MNVGDVDHVHTVDAAAVPREEAIARAAGQPANAAEAAAESEPKANSQPSSAKAEEGDIRRCPDRVVSAVDRSRQPTPGPPPPPPPQKRKKETSPGPQPG